MLCWFGDAYTLVLQWEDYLSAKNRKFVLNPNFFIFLNQGQTRIWPDLINLFRLFRLHLKYLDSLVATTTKDVKTRKGQAWTTFWKIQCNLWFSAETGFEHTLFASKPDALSTTPQHNQREKNEHTWPIHRSMGIKLAQIGLQMDKMDIKLA